MNGKYFFTSESVNSFDNAKKIYFLKFIQENFDKISQREMARELNIGKTTVNRWSRELGLKTKKNTVNEGFFRKFSPQMSYILGYIITDGNIMWDTRKSYRSLTITAAEKDKQHLERIRSILKSTKELLYSEKTKSYRLIVTNKKICLDLMKLGITPRKSLTVKFPKIPKEYLKDFIRGVIDGDGSVRYVDRKRSPYFEITVFSGSPKFLKQLARVIEEEINVSTKLKKVHKNTFSIRYTCKKGKILADWIYKDAKLFLNRKFKQYLIMKKTEVVVPEE
jgi:hypothetical protein